MRENVGDWSIDPERHSASDRLTVRRLEWILDSLRKLGCSVNPSSRLPAAIRLVQTIRNVRSLLNDPGVRAELEEAQKAAWEFMLILIAAAEANPNSSIFTKEKLELAITGAMTADEANSVGRNTQFELYVPALFAISGFDISAGTADARWTFGGEQLEIEAKRMRSETEEKLRANLSKAAEQIMGPRSGGIIEVVRSRGIVAVNIDVHMATVPALDSKLELVQEFSKRLEILDRAGKPLLSRHGLVGVLAVGCVAHWELESDGHAANHLMLSYPTRWASMVGDDVAEMSSIQRYYGAIEAIGCKVDELQLKVPKLLAR